MLCRQGKTEERGSFKAYCGSGDMRHTEKFKGAIFDFGNTLCASARLAASLPAVWPDTRAGIVGEYIEARIAALYRPQQSEQPDWKCIWQEAFERNGCDWSEDVALAHLRHFLDAGILYPYTKNVLYTLRQAGLKLALLSNATGPPEVFHDDLLTKGLRDAFDVVIWSCEIGYRKPSRQAFATAIDRLGLDPKDVLMIGDSEVADIVGAQQAGIATARIVDVPNTNTQADYTVAREHTESRLIQILTGP